MKLNIGCGRDIRKGWVNIDISKEVGADCVWDIRKGIPLSDNTVDEIAINNVLCQIDKEFKDVMNELWRVCRGSITLRVPNAEDICAFQDPEDCRRFTDQTFTYMQYGHRRYEQYGKHYGYKPFDVELLEKGVQLTFKLCPRK